MMKLSKCLIWDSIFFLSVNTKIDHNSRQGSESVHVCGSELTYTVIDSSFIDSVIFSG